MWHRPRSFPELGVNEKTKAGINRTQVTAPATGPHLRSKKLPPFSFVPSPTFLKISRADCPQHAKPISPPLVQIHGHVNDSRPSTRDFKSSLVSTRTRRILFVDMMGGSRVTNRAAHQIPRTNGPSRAFFTPMKLRRPPNSHARIVLERATDLAFTDKFNSYIHL
jgi:hypothetical protein